MNDYKRWDHILPWIRISDTPRPAKRQSGRRTPQHSRDEVKALLNRGYTNYTEIGRIVGVSPGVVARVARDIGMED